MLLNHPGADPACGLAAAGGRVSRLSAGRRPELDFMRAFVVAGLVVFHSAMVFAPGSSWFVTDPRPSTGFAVFLLWGSLWGMPLLFVVSGMGARYAMRTRSAGAFAQERLARLLVPFAVGLVVLVPPMFYLAVLGQPGFREPYWRFWVSFLNLPAITAGLLARGSWTTGGSTFDPAHLWFLYVLLVLSLVLLPLFAFLRGPRGVRLISAMAGFAQRHPLMAMAIAALPVMAVEAVFGPDANTGGWERVAYMFPFLYGFVIASDPRFETALRRARWPALAVALPATTVLAAWAGRTASAAGAPPGWGALQGLAGCAWLTAILGFAALLTARTRNRQSITPYTRPAASAPRWRRAARYATEAVLPFYLLHEPVIVAAAWFIVRWHAPILDKYAALVLVSFAATLALYEVLIRRFRVPRLLLGMKASAGPERMVLPRASLPWSRA